MMDGLGPISPIEILNGSITGTGDLEVTGPDGMILVIMSIAGYQTAGSSVSTFTITIDGNAVFGGSAASVGAAFAQPISSLSIWHPVAPGQVVQASLFDTTGDSFVSFAVGGICTSPFGV